jgi:hypothetical protein
MSDLHTKLLLDCTENTALLTILFRGATDHTAAYRLAAAEKADIIIKITEDRSFGATWTLTLHVYDPEDNRELYKESESMLN